MSLLGPLLDATAFLTRVPLPARRDFDLARAAWAFPVVGAATGLVLGAVGVLTAGPLGWFAAAVLVVVVEVLLTGALHLDGLADCADGTGGRDRQARLQIMKDHSVGVYGVAAVVLDLLLKVALVGGLLAQLPDGGIGAAGGDIGTAGFLVVTTLAWTLSRTVMLPLAAALPYARADGTGRALVEGLTGRRVAVALVVAGVLVVAAVATGLVISATPAATITQVLTVVAVVGAVGLLIARWARRTLGGVTGDVLGAAAEVTLLAALLTALLLD